MYHAFSSTNSISFFELLLSIFPRVHEVVCDWYFLFAIATRTIRFSTKGKKRLHHDFFYLKTQDAYLGSG